MHAISIVTDNEFCTLHFSGAITDNISKITDAIPSIIGSTASSGPFVINIKASWKPQEIARAFAT
nr:MAG TPA: hypothetical protein [Caudoviricetes sp.]